MRITAKKGLRVAVAAAVAASASVFAVVSMNQAEAAAPQSGTPDVATQNANGNHAMGSMVRLYDPAAQRVEASQSPQLSATVEGIDVASYQGNVNWASWWSQGKRFAWVKATEGTGYTNPYFSQQYNGSYNVGMIRGAYHFARPDSGGGAAQADYFIAHGGGWSADGKTLPGTLDIEWGPNSACYGLSQASMASWIKAFSDRYYAKTNKYPAIYTATSWWSQCVGSHSFASTNPLWVARYASSAGTLPYNWGFYTVWQYSSAGNMDKDRFNGSMTQLQTFAKNHD